MVTTTFLPFIITLASFICFTSALTSAIFLSHNRSKTWTNHDGPASHRVRFTDNSTARLILVKRHKSFLQMGLCFYCSSSDEDKCSLSMIMGVFLYPSNNANLLDPPHVVWSANSSSPVRRNSTLELSSNGLVLRNTNGTTVWESPTKGKSIHGMKICIRGNLVLFDHSNETLWQTFDNPTNTLLVGQTLRKGQCLTSGKSSTNKNHPMFRLCVSNLSLTGFVEVEISHKYLNVTPLFLATPDFRLLQVTLHSDRLRFAYQTSHAEFREVSYPITRSVNYRFLRLDDDGGIRMYSWGAGPGWQTNSHSFDGVEERQIPLKCGRYGVFESGHSGQCSCPGTLTNDQYFKFTDRRNPDSGCSLRNFFSPPETLVRDYQLISFGNLSYFSYFDPAAAITGLNTEESCKQKCLDEQFCKAAFFKFSGNGSEGECYLPTEILSMVDEASYLGSPFFNTSSFIKVPNPHGQFSTSYLRKLVLFFLVFYIFSVFSICLFLRLKNRNRGNSSGRLEKLSRYVRKFPYDELCLATGNFAEQLGGGGFGMVFKGVLKDGTLIAVKRHDRAGQGLKEFLAEVDTLGRIQHVSVVKLIGICLEKRRKMIVYEYMINGSLEKWIFDDSKNTFLDWKMRKKILLDISKGLAYLHEDCWSKIAHLDVKPGNILLGESFTAKLSDFGMSKLIKRDESQVMTLIRGTIGYLAPEWQISGITVKADIYSFGVVLLEVISGRKNLDHTLPRSDVHLLSLLQVKAFENKLSDIIDSRSEEMQSHKEEVIEVIKLGIWCLNKDYKKRPSMSLVVKILEGVAELKDNISCNLPFVVTP